MSSKIRHKRNLVGHQRTQYARSYICDQRDYYDKCSWDIEHILAHTSEHTLVRNHIHVTCVTSFFLSRKCYKPPEDLLTLEISLMKAYEIICGYTMCDKDLQLYYCLKSHLKVHTEEKPNKCDNILNTKNKSLKNS